MSRENLAKGAKKARGRHHPSGGARKVAPRAKSGRSRAGLDGPRAYALRVRLNTPAPILKKDLRAAVEGVLGHYYPKARVQQIDED